MSHLKSPITGHNAAPDVDMERDKASAYGRKHGNVLDAVFQKLRVGPQPAGLDIVRLSSPVWLTVGSRSLKAHSQHAWAGLFREQLTITWCLNFRIPYGAAAPEQAGRMVDCLTNGLCKIVLLLNQLDRFSFKGGQKSSQEFMKMRDMIEQAVATVQTEMVSQALERIVSDDELRALPTELVKH